MPASQRHLWADYSTLILWGKGEVWVATGFLPRSRDIDTLEWGQTRLHWGHWA